MHRDEISDQINQSLHELINNLMVRTGFINRTPGLCSQLMEYTLRDGKRLRSVFLAMSYLGQHGEPCRYLFRCAASMELFHLFALIQDDIIDNSNLRRGKHSLHYSIKRTIRDSSMTEAQNLAIVYSDILYSAAIEAFLEIDTDPHKKINALKTVIDAAICTGSGQFLELVYSSENPRNLGLADIYTIYDLKTARYTFCGPLVAGAQLAGAMEPVLSALYQAGLYLGRAYQIADDLQECLNTAHPAQIPSDIAEHRNTVLMWHLYHHGTAKVRHFIENLNQNCTVAQVSELYRMFDQTGSFEFAQSEKNRFTNLALNTLTQDIFRTHPELVKDIIAEISNMCTLERIS